MSGILFARYTFFPQVDKLPKLPPEFASYRLKFFFFNSFAKSVFTGQEATKLLPMPKIYGRFPVFILSALFNDADMFFKLKRFLFCIRGFGDSEYEERKAV